MDSSLKVFPAFNPFSSSSNEEEDRNDKTKIKRKRGKGRAYEHKKTFNSREAASNFIEDQRIWSKAVRTNTEEGDKVYYRCNQVPISADPCPCALYLLYHSTNEKVRYS